MSYIQIQKKVNPSVPYSLQNTQMATKSLLFNCFVHFVMRTSKISVRIVGCSVPDVLFVMDYQLKSNFQSNAVLADTHTNKWDLFLCDRLYVLKDCVYTTNGGFICKTKRRTWKFEYKKDRKNALCSVLSLHNSYSLIKLFFEKKKKDACVTKSSAIRSLKSIKNGTDAFAIIYLKKKDVDPLQF